MDHDVNNHVAETGKPLLLYPLYISAPSARWLRNFSQNFTIHLTYCNYMNICLVWSKAIGRGATLGRAEFFKVRIWWQKAIYVNHFKGDYGLARIGSLIVSHLTAVCRKSSHLAKRCTPRMPPCRLMRRAGFGLLAIFPGNILGLNPLGKPAVQSVALVSVLHREKISGGEVALGGNTIA